MPTLYPTADAEVYIHIGSNRSFLELTADPPPFYLSGYYQMVSGSGFSGLDATIQVSKGPGWIYVDYMYQVRRYIVEFDTSGVNRAPVNANLQIFGAAVGNDADIICVETTLQSNGSITGQDFVGHNETNPVDYTETVSGSSISAAAFNPINFIDTGLSAMGNLDRLQMTCMEATYDYARIEPPTWPPYPAGVKTLFLQDTDDNSYDTWQPKLSYTMRVPDKISSGKVIIKSGQLTIK